MIKKITTIEGLAEMIQRTMASKEDIKQFATKEDLKQVRAEMVSCASGTASAKTNVSAQSITDDVSHTAPSCRRKQDARSVAVSRGQANSFRRSASNSKMGARNRGQPS